MKRAFHIILLLLLIMTTALIIEASNTTTDSESTQSIIAPSEPPKASSDSGLTKWNNLEVSESMKEILDSVKTIGWVMNPELLKTSATLYGSDMEMEYSTGEDGIHIGYILFSVDTITGDTYKKLNKGLVSDIGEPDASMETDGIWSDVWMDETSGISISLLFDDDLLGILVTDQIDSKAIKPDSEQTMG